jgi:osmotically-inducible protein OsmY
MLSGEVRHREEKYQAEDIAANVTGVTEVKNQIQVRGASMRGANQRRD